MLNVYEATASNKRKTWIIMVLFVVFISVFAWVIGEAMDYGTGFVGLALIISGIMSFGSYWYSDKIILTISKARPATRQEFFNFYTATENLVMVARIPMPKLYVIDDTAMNAFATGRDPQHAVVCATTGILQRLDRTELEGVIAHELSHIQNYDIRLMSIVTILVGFVTLLADWFLRASFYGKRSNSKGQEGQLRMVIGLIGVVLALLSPLIAQLIKLALSRQRESLADASAVKLTRQPSGLINALRKLDADQEPLEAANKATAHLYITNPLKNRHGGVGWFATLFMTHPPIEQRIKALEAMS
ncbi:M48 family metallopeptidase [Candidatus Beckwithbacteria bacterium]|nr:M48 family metallopeptidase [Candidatus Beckwithbacteria bacterium]